MKHDPKPKPRTRMSKALLGGSAALALFSAVAGPMIYPAHADTLRGSDTTMLTEDGSFSEIVKMARPAVVTITTERKPVLSQMQAQGPQGMPQGDAFEDMFRRFFGDRGAPLPQGVPVPQQPPQEQVQRALGSGFVIDASGIIVTNHHVIDQADSIKVVLDNGEELDATLLGSDQKTDLAVLKVEAAEDLPTLQWGDSDAAETGDRVIAVGNPFGVGTTVTAGIVSARGRDLHNGPYDNFLQVDAALNHGNSGGPLLDVHGRVIGISDAIFSPNNGNVGVGFAIPAVLAQKIVDEIVDKGTVERGYLGVQIQPVSADIADAVGLTSANGAMVSEVQSGTPAETAGLLPADVIVSVNGNDLADPRALSSAIADLDPGETVTLGVWRGDETIDVPVTLASYPGDETLLASGDASATAADIPQLGFSVSNLTPELRAQFGLSDKTEGVVVSGYENDVAAEGPVRPGDVILSVGGEDVVSAQDVRAGVAAAEQGGKEAVLMKIERNGVRSFVAVPLGNA